jgi:hypothetical protein
MIRQRRFGWGRAIRSAPKTMSSDFKPSRRHGATFAVAATRSVRTDRAPRHDARAHSGRAEGLTE